MSRSDSAGPTESWVAIRAPWSWDKVWEQVCVLVCATVMDVAIWGRGVALGSPHGLYFQQLGMKASFLKEEPRHTIPLKPPALSLLLASAPLHEVVPVPEMSFPSVQVP